MPQLGERAIVIGASMSGLLTARVLSDHYREVVLLERDAIPAEPGLRKGVPQAAHTHALLPRGRETLEALFPKLTSELAGQGAVLGDPLADVRRYMGGGYYCQRPTGRLGLMVSRPTLEAYVRSRVLALPNVHAIDGIDVLAPVATDARTRVTGVRTIPHSASTTAGGARVWDSDLGVDATGRGSRTPAWLAALGYAPPQEETVRVGMAYVTRLYRRRPEHLHGAKMLMVAPTPECRRAAIAIAQEGDRWTVTLAGYAGNHPPLDEAGLREFARGYPAPEVLELVQQAEPLGPPVRAIFPANRRRRYERLASFPEGFLVVGDAICSFNPMCGQGMTVAALEAAVLAECLVDTAGMGRPGELRRRFFARAAAAIDVPWGMNSANDRYMTEAEGEPGLRTRLLRWYLGRLHVAARHEPAAALAFIMMAGLIAPPASILRPALVLRVCRGNLPRRRGAAPPSASSIVHSMARPPLTSSVAPVIHGEASPSR